MPGGFCVASAAGSESSFVYRLGNGSIFTQVFCEPPCPARYRIRLGSHANGLLEQPLKVERAKPGD